MGSRWDPWQTRFWKYAKRGSPDECWEWNGAYDRAGYGRLRARNAKGKNLWEGAHRLSWRLHNGPIPDGSCVCHHCDNRKCVNPAHLFLGSVVDNNYDMCAKGRQRNHRGEEHISSKLTDAAVLDMRRRYAAGGVSQRQLGREYGVEKTTAWDAINGMTWAHVAAYSEPSP